MSGRCRLLALLAAALISGCAPKLPSSATTGYRVIIPPLAVQPVARECHVGDRWLPCVLILRDDYEALIRALKGACLALGQSDEECQTGKQAAGSGQ